MKKLISLLLILFLLVPAATAEETELPDSYNWYEIFVYSYQDSDGDGIGDFNGVRQRLDYIADMAIPASGSCPSCPALPIISTT